MNKYKLIWLITLIASLICASFIVIYYWSNSTFESVKFVPINVMILAMIYVFSQIVRRYFIRLQNWWDWLYYLGLSSMMLPVFFMSDSNHNYYHLITDYGTLFLIVPILFDLKYLYNDK